MGVQAANDLCPAAPGNARPGDHDDVSVRQFVLIETKTFPHLSFETVSLHRVAGRLARYDQAQPGVIVFSQAGEHGKQGIR